MTIQLATFWPRRTRIRGLALCGVLFALILCGALAIPFLFESFSIKYKFGLHKGLLRTGKLVGTGAAVLLMAQLLLVARLAPINRLVAMDRLVVIHKYNGIVIALLALVHPLLIFGPEEITTLPLEKAFWPEMVGAGLLIGIFYMATAALYKRELGFPFHLWMVAHRIGGTLLLSALFVHLLFSSETFEKGLPRTLGLLFATGCLLLLIIRHAPPLRPLTSWIVSGVSPAGTRATRVTLAPASNQSFRYLPGQFAFLTFPASVISPEPHPFTIASSPTTPDAIEFVVGKSGDWTAGIDCIQEGETATIEGPYGFFTHLMLESEAPLVLIAGGIGITPMLSMIRDLNATGDPRQIVLIWSNRNPDALFSAEELAAMKVSHPMLSIHLLFTDPPENDRLTPEYLQQCTQNLSSPQVFLCGPPPMMTAVEALLQGIGIHKNRIHTETFGF